MLIPAPQMQCLCSLSSKTSHCKILWNLKAMRLNVIMIILLWNFTGISAVLLSSCHLNFRVIGKVGSWISRLLRIHGFWDFTKSFGVRGPSTKWIEAQSPAEFNLSWPQAPPRLHILIQEVQTMWPILISYSANISLSSVTCWPHTELRRAQKMVINIPYGTQYFKSWNFQRNCCAVQVIFLLNCHSGHDHNNNYHPSVSMFLWDLLNTT